MVAGVLGSRRGREGGEDRREAANGLGSLWRLLFRRPPILVIDPFPSEPTDGGTCGGLLFFALLRGGVPGALLLVGTVLPLRSFWLASASFWTATDFV